MEKNKQQGFAIGYFILALSLMSLMIYAISGLSTSNASLAWVAKSSEAVLSQATMVREKILTCGTAFPGGDNGSASSSAEYKKYPATPVSGLLKDAVCPGSSREIFTGHDGVFLRKLPNGFSEWAYTNDLTGMYIGATVAAGMAADAAAAVASQAGVGEVEYSGGVLKFWVSKI